MEVVMHSFSCNFAYAASIFRVEMMEVRIWPGYKGRCLEMWLFRTMGWGGRKSPAKVNRKGVMK
jgi:hypothetical protein